MSVKIVPITDHECYKVNDHTIFKDSLGNWNSESDLSTREREAFYKYEDIVIKNPRFKRHTQAIYKG